MHNTQAFLRETSLRYWCSYGALRWMAGAEDNEPFRYLMEHMDMTVVTVDALDHIYYDIFLEKAPVWDIISTMYDLIYDEEIDYWKGDKEMNHQGKMTAIELCVLGQSISFSYPGGINLREEARAAYAKILPRYARDIRWLKWGLQYRLEEFVKMHGFDESLIRCDGGDTLEGSDNN